MFDRYVSAVILQNFLHYGQPHPSAIFFAVAHKWLEQMVPNRIGDTGTVILDTNFQIANGAVQADIDFARFRGHSFAGVEE